jgi:DNA modification methylase
MASPKVIIKNEKELQEAILQDKARGVPDIEIGQKYGVTFRYIEKLITKSKGIAVSALRDTKKIKALSPKEFKEEQTTVWSFKQRGNWATHSGEYRGNWSPYIPRNVILKYSKPGELVLDYFCGAGTTAVEAKLLGRKCIALDINDAAIELAKRNLDFEITSSKQLFFVDGEERLQVYEPELLVGDSRDLSFLRSNSIDLICAHPPYANIIHYTDSKQGDLSYFDIDDFLKEMSKVAQESFRVLKPGKQCAILIGDMRRKKHVVPLGFELTNVYLNAGFRLRELVIKRQHNCKTTGFWYESSMKYNFLLLAHEYLPIFEKPRTHVSLRVEEEGVGYSLLVPTLERPPLKRKLDEIETTTVWVLPAKDFEKRLNKNVIERYSNGGGYSTVTFTSYSNRDDYTAKSGSSRGLLFIKAPFLSGYPSRPNVDSYLQQTLEITSHEVREMSAGGFVVLQTQDVRIGDYLEPVAKRLIDSLSFDDLWLKEIIVVTHETQSSDCQTSKRHLRVDHQYLIVYEVRK